MFQKTLTGTGAVMGLGFALLIAPAAADHHKESKKQDAQKKDGFEPLFNGENLDGWSVRSGEAAYRVEDNAIVGQTVKGSPNTFLTTDQQYKDFVLKFEVKLDDDELNSGVQVRSKLRGEQFRGRLHGPQVEIEARPGDAGFIYGEAIGGWLSEPTPDHELFKRGAWNQFRVRAEGNHIDTWVNGEKVADLDLPSDVASQHREGRIGLQVHSIGEDQGPYQVRWRNIDLKPINK